MPSASKKLDLIRKRKDKPNKANLKADEKRICKNREILKKISSSEKA